MTNNSLYKKTEPDTPLKEAYHVRSYKKTSPLGTDYLAEMFAQQGKSNLLRRFEL